MRLVVVNLGLLALSFSVGGCRGCDQPAASLAPTERTPLPLGTLPPPREPWRPAVDCDQLLGAARASQLMGRLLVATTGAGLAASECRYAPSAADSSVYIDVLYACREAAAPLARSVMTRLQQGADSANVGQQSVVFRDGARGVVQLLHLGTPCAVQVTTLPADQALAAARDIESRLSGIKVAP